MLPTRNAHQFCALCLCRTSQVIRNLGPREVRSSVIPQINRNASSFNTWSEYKPVTRKRNLSRLAYQEDELYDKSFISFLKKEHPGIHMITAFSSKGFTLNDDNKVLGPMILLPQAILHWRIQDPKEITPSSLLVFTLMHPKPDILVLGTGDRIVPLSEESQKLLKDAGIAVEVQRTETALATYNFLAVEDRITVGAFCLVSPQAAFTKLDAIGYESLEEELIFEEEPALISTEVAADSKLEKASEKILASELIFEEESALISANTATESKVEKEAENLKSEVSSDVSQAAAEEQAESDVKNVKEKKKRGRGRPKKQIIAD